MNNGVMVNIQNALERDRVIFITGKITDDTANQVITRLMYLCDKDRTKKVRVYINSPGGSVLSGLAIYDALKFVGNTIVTICYGLAASMGALLLSAGTKNYRYAFTNCRIMIHQPNGSFDGNVDDIKIQAKEIMLLKRKINKILAENTGRTVKDIREDTSKDYYMSAKKAVSYGLIDKIIRRVK